jgi:hypothetical protein
MTTLVSLLLLAVLSNPPAAPDTATAKRFGQASYYCNNDLRRADRSDCHYKYPDRVGSAQLYAAAGPPLKRMLGADWRGTRVTVLGNGHFVRVTLVDSCACPTRVIDLYADAFERLKPLSAGVLDVVVVHEALPPLPPTDTAP